MKNFDQLTTKMETVLGPLTEKIQSNRFIKGISAGFMNIMCVTLGVAAIAILSNIPYEPYMNFLEQTGLYSVAQEFIALTVSLMGIYAVGTVAYFYAKEQDENPVTAMVISLASFIALMPMQIAEDGYTSFLLTKYLGSEGIFVAIIVGLSVSEFYCFLCKKNIKLNLSDSVPPMVTESLSPTFSTIIIFTVVFLIKYGFTLTSYNNLYDFISIIVTKPVMALGATPLSYIILYTVANFLWFFGLHPSAVTSSFMPIVMTVSAANVAAYTSGQPLPYMINMIVGTAVYLGGNGNTLGLCIAMMFARSSKYKEMRKVVIPVNIFNINEPLVFGVPLMYNPTYFIPMVFSSAFAGFICWGLGNVLPITLNPTVGFPWVIPGIFSALLQGGLLMGLIWCTALLCHFLIYLPFFIMDDLREYKLEQANESTVNVAATDVKEAASVASDN